ncbi:MAG TPA: hypothetical protein VN428_24015 [Bryobacteraceae bacterium]|nr:hypothetical protein [Bryobacteraceae bacterium]
MLFALLLAAVTTVLATLVAILARRANADGSLGQSREFRPDRYRPLNRLLSSEDLAFMSEQGMPFHRVLVYRFRRFRVTWAYLRALSGDFGRVHRSARLLIVCSDVDLPELSAALMRAQVVFWGASALAHSEAVVMLLGLSLGIKNAESALGSLLNLSRAVAAAELRAGAALSNA